LFFFHEKYILNTFNLLCYKDLDASGLDQKFKKVCNFLANGDFKSAEVKKLSLSGYLRAKLDDTNRLLFKMIKANNGTHILLLEIIRNHNYDKSRFLRGAQVSEIHIQSYEEITANIVDDLRFLGAPGAKVHCLDRFIMFDEIQNNIFHYGLPLILIGSAGSGKTSLTIEKIKTIPGEVLYVTLSPYLAFNARQLYYANNYQNEEQIIDFLSFEELIETIAIPKGEEININSFLHWYQKQKKSNALSDGRKLYEEFRGVIAGSEHNAAYLSKDAYLNLGIRKSVYSDDERQEVYQLFKSYVSFLDEGKYFDTNILSFEYKEKVTPRYDAVVIDEVQDFTNSQLALILATLRTPHQFFMCGDANQIVHPNFFSWSSLKQLFYHSTDLANHEITRILTRNYRNTQEVTELANRILKVKNSRFGSIDKESHYLIESQSVQKGDVACIQATPEKINDINQKISKSTAFAIITLTDKHKEEAQKLFGTPLIFTAQEAKGLEYENVILYNFIAGEPKFLDIAKGLTPDIINQDFKYGRAKSKADKSMEIFKFYINSLYVGITRAINNVYLIEKNTNHPLISLLNINEINQALNIQASESSLEDWQKEASKLIQQGKTEQAAAINELILHQKTPSWTVIDKSEYVKMLSCFTLESKLDKKEQLSLFEAAMFFDDVNTVNRLKEYGLKAAVNPKKSYPIMYDKHFSKYSIKNTQAVHRDIQMYGLEHRTVMNLTPLMAAIYSGNIKLINEVIDLGSSLEQKDSLGRNPLQFALHRAISDEKNRMNMLSEIYNRLSVTSLSLDTDGALIKIDASRAEYLLFNLILTFYRELMCYELTNNVIEWMDGIRSIDIVKLVEKLPTSIWPAYRKKQSYISSLLSRNEVNSNYSPNRKLFKRVARGYYIINPSLKVKTTTGWRYDKSYAYPISEPLESLGYEQMIDKLLNG